MAILGTGILNNWQHCQVLKHETMSATYKLYASLSEGTPLWRISPDARSNEAQP